MPLTEQEIKEIKDAVDASARPLVFFDDDCDGTASFVQLYRYKQEGKGVPVKASPMLDRKYARKVEEYAPDLVLILDKPLVDDEFFENVKSPIIWLDHHKPQDVSRWQNVRYYNPRLHDDKDNLPVTYWMYRVTGGPLWIATVGAIADWHIPDYFGLFKEQYPDLLPSGYARVEDLLYSPDSRLGRLARIISFNLKGTAQETMKSVLVLTRIETPYEILNQTTPRGKYLYKKYARLATKYEGLLHRAKSALEPDSPVLLFLYEDESMSLTSDLSNELLYQYPERFIVIARKHGGEYKYSLRSGGRYEIPPIMGKALQGVDGYGGGHTYACGASVKEKDNEKFLAVIREEITRLDAQRQH